MRLIRCRRINPHSSMIAAGMMRASAMTVAMGDSLSRMVMAVVMTPWSVFVVVMMPLAVMCLSDIRKKDRACSEKS